MSGQELYSPAAHGDHPSLEYQGHLVDLLSHCSHLLLADRAHLLLQGGPEYHNTVMVVMYNWRVEKNPNYDLFDSNYPSRHS